VDGRGLVNPVDPHETGEATGGLPGARGFEIAFVMSAGVAPAAAACGLLIPARRVGEAGGAALPLLEP
jgi:hypothetical protein